MGTNYYLKDCPDPTCDGLNTNPCHHLGKISFAGGQVFDHAQSLEEIAGYPEETQMEDEFGGQMSMAGFRRDVLAGCRTESHVGEHFS